MKSEDKTEKMINTVDGLESSKTNVANDKTAKVDDQVQTENVKQEIGSPSKITTGHCDTLNTNAQEPNKNKNEISGQTMAGQTMPGHTVASLTMPGQAMPDQTMPGQTMSGCNFAKPTHGRYDNGRSNDTGLY